MKRTFNSNWGNFAYALVANIVEETLSEKTLKLIDEGMANLSYRACGSSVAKALGVKTGSGEEGRRGVLYSDEDAERINKAANDKLTKLGFSDSEISFSVTGQHEYGAEEKPTKEATEAWTKIQAMPEPRFTEKCKLIGIDPESYEDADAILKVRRFLIDTARKAKENAFA